MPQPNPLSGSQNRLRVPVMPKLAERMKGKVLTPEDARAHDAAMEEWRQSHERIIVEHFEKLLTQIQAGKTG